MKNDQPYPEEFKIEAVKQITERGHKVAEVSDRIGVSQHSLYKWLEIYGQPADARQAQNAQAEELRRLKRARPEAAHGRRHLLHALCLGRASSPLAGEVRPYN